tara:strand:- start:47 stop:376 length:330 start_codon:yes stop_codon:yes gene_type:complete
LVCVARQAFIDIAAAFAVRVIAFVIGLACTGIGTDVVKAVCIYTAGVRVAFINVIAAKTIATISLITFAAVFAIAVVAGGIFIALICLVSTLIDISAAPVPNICVVIPA